VPEPSIGEKFNALPPTAKTAIYASSAGVGAVIIAFAMFYCIRQRRRGANEAKLAEQKAEQERMELARFKKAGVNPDSFVDSAAEYNAKDMRQGGMSDSNSYSVPNTPSATPNEKWDQAAAVGAGAAVGATAAGAGTAAAMRSPMPLLRDGAQSPRVTSPTSPGNGFNTPYTDRTPNTRSPAPNMPNFSAGPNFGAGHAPMGSPGPNPAMRGYSTPNPDMRRGSPGPQQAGYGGGMRMNSPAPLAQPLPQRSYTGGGYAQNINQAYGHPAPQGGQPPQGYWGNNGGYR